MVENGTVCAYNRTQIMFNCLKLLQFLWPIAVNINELPYVQEKRIVHHMNYVDGSITLKPNMNIFLQSLLVQKRNLLHNVGFSKYVHMLIPLYNNTSYTVIVCRFTANFTKHPNVQRSCQRLFFLFTYERQKYSMLDVIKTKICRCINIKNTYAQHLQNCIEVLKRRKISNGIKDLSILLLLKPFNIISSIVLSTCILLRTFIEVVKSE